MDAPELPPVAVALPPVALGLKLSVMVVSSSLKLLSLQELPMHLFTCWQ